MKERFLLLMLLLSGCAQQVHEEKVEDIVLNDSSKEETLIQVPLQQDTTLTVLWREDKFDADLGTSIRTLVLNDKYFNSISDAERAAIGYVSSFVGSDCEWDGEPNEDMSNLSCIVTEALDLGYQCSVKHQNFLKKWFRESPEQLAKLRDCSAVPATATVQNTFNKIVVTKKGDFIKVNFEASGVNMREEAFWDWSEELEFKVSDDKLKLISQKRTDSN